MRAYTIIPAIFLILGISAEPLFSRTVSDSTAKKALGRLPKAEGHRLAKIIAVGGTPVPESWHILSYDPESETGISERIVANGRMSEPAEASEHASYLTGEDVIGRQAVKIDTDRVFSAANQYALANDLLVTSMNYVLEKNALGDAVWTVECMDDRDAVVGSLVLAADSGEVLSREGFAVEPVLMPVKQTTTRRGKLKMETDAEPMVGAEFLDDLGEDYDFGETVAGGSAERLGSSSERKSSGSVRSRSGRKARRTDSGDVARTVTRPVRRVLRRVLPF